MAKESTLNNADVALVARSIQTAVDKYKLHPVSTVSNNEVESKMVESDSKTKIATSKPPNKQTEIKILPDKKDEKKEESKPEQKTDEVEKEKDEKPDEQPTVTAEPKKDEVVASKSTVETKKREKKKGNHKKGISFTVVQIKKKENGLGWDVHVRITALEVTTISFSVEQMKSIEDTVKQLSNEVVKNNLITEAQREKAEELLKKLIKRLFDGHMIQGTRFLPICLFSGDNSFN